MLEIIYTSPAFVGVQKLIGVDTVQGVWYDWGVLTINNNTDIDLFDCAIFIDVPVGSEWMPYGGSNSAAQDLNEILLMALPGNYDELGGIHYNLCELSGVTPWPGQTNTPSLHSNFFSHSLGDIDHPVPLYAFDNLGVHQPELDGVIPAWGSRNIMISFYAPSGVTLYSIMQISFFTRCSYYPSEIPG